MKVPSKKRGKTNTNGAGELYVVSTPIGNMEDITLRALDTLRRVGVIACEDTRRIRKLLSHYKIHGKELISYYRGVEEGKSSRLLRLLEQGQDIALVSDAGTPGVADPGLVLIRQARDLSLPVRVVPGPCAALAALTASALPADNFLFLGFLPRNKKTRRAFLSPLRWEKRTLAFYEAPHRLGASLADIAAAFGRRRMAIARELTKLNEEVLWGRAYELAEKLRSHKIRGEVTIILEGYAETPWEVKGSWSGYSLAAHLEKVMQEEDLSLSRAVEKIEQLRDVPKEVLYKIAKESGLEGKRK